MFECMEIAGQVYEDDNTYKNTNRAESDRSSHDSKCNGVEAALSDKPKTGRASKRKKNYAGHPINWPTGAKTCLVHGPG